MDGGAWWAAVHGVTKSRTRLSDFTFTLHFHALEKAMETHSSVLAWRIPGMGEPGRLPSMGSNRVGHDWCDLAAEAAAAALQDLIWLKGNHNFATRNNLLNVSGQEQSPVSIFRLSLILQGFGHCATSPQEHRVSRTMPRPGAGAWNASTGDEESQETPFREPLTAKIREGDNHQI